jgi:protein-disulfide isomerase
VQAVASVALLVAAIALMRSPREPVAGHSSRTRQQAARAREGERTSLLRTGQAGAGVATLAVAALLALGAIGGTPTVSPGPSGFAPGDSPRLGSGAIEVVEFADFQCPGCAVLAPIITELASANEMTLVSRYFPLDANHANADRSARAAAAADRQGSFWEMSAALYARQAAWKDLSGTDADAFFLTLAGELGLDTAEWQAAYQSAETAAVVDVDRQAAIAMGLNSTPTLFIGGTQYTGPLSADGIRAAIAAASGP